MELITTPAHPKANSYYSLTQAENYLTNNDRISSADNWFGLSDEQKKLALYIGAQALNLFKYKGVKVVQTQSLAFPRYTWRQMKVENKKQYKDFFWATLPENLETLVTDSELEISDSKIYDRTSSADLFYNLRYRGYIDTDQIIKQVGFSCDTYLTVTYIDPDGEYLEIKEDISNEAAPSSGVSLYSTPLFGFPDEIGMAQTEIAVQYASDILTQDFNEMPEAPYRRLELGGTLMVWYKDKFMSGSRFSTDKSNSMDLVYYYLGEWMSATGARLV